MTPHTEHPWIPIAGDLEEITSRQIIRHGYIGSDSIETSEFFNAVRDIAAGRVETSKWFLARLIREIHCQSEFGLDDESLKIEAAIELPKHELRDAAAPLWAALVQRGLVELPNVKLEGASKNSA